VRDDFEDRVGGRGDSCPYIDPDDHADAASDGYVDAQSHTHGDADLYLDCDAD
jgi:hypothetical protein